MPTALHEEPITEPDWVAAGRAWGHAAVDWAYRFEPYAVDAIESIFGRLGVAAGTELFDMACGSGFAAARAERLGATVAGLDASADLIDIARQRAVDADLRVGDMFALPWDDDSFDAVTSFNGVWGGCTDALVEARRVIRDGGRIGLTFWGPGRALDLRDWFIAVGTATPSIGTEMIGLAQIGTPGVVEEMLDDAGFGSIERYGTPSIIESPDAEALLRTMRSPGLVEPAIAAIGLDDFDRLTLDALAHCRADDGSYRLVNELTCVVATAT